MKRFLRVWAVLAPLALALASPCGAEDKAVTVQEAEYRSLVASEKFQRLHDVMKEEKRHLNDLMDAFLYGNEAEVARLAGIVTLDMKRAAFKLEGSQESAETWLSMAKVVSEATSMKESIDAGDSRGAFRHYTAMAGQCLQCHQAVRPWGALPEWKEGSR